MQPEALERTEFPRRDQFVIAGVGVSDTTAAGRHALQPALVDRLHGNENGARLRDLLRLDQLFAAPELACRDVVLHIGNYHRNDRPRLGNAGGLGHHSDLHDLSLELPKPRRESTPSRTLRNQNAGRPYHWIDDITRPQSELL